MGNDVIAEQVQRMAMGSAQEWEKVLKLHIRPKPKWMAKSMWRHLIRMVLYQTETQWEENRGKA